MAAGGVYAAPACGPAKLLPGSGCRGTAHQRSGHEHDQHVFEAVTYLHTGQPVNVALFQRNSVFGFTAIALLAAGLVLLAITGDSLVYRLCRHPWLRAIGQRSYGFYVYHLLFFAVWQRLAVALMLGHRRFTLEGTACVALAGTLVLSWASFRWIEAPMLRLKARLAV